MALHSQPARGAFSSWSFITDQFPDLKAAVQAVTAFRSCEPRGYEQDVCRGGQNAWLSLELMRHHSKRARALTIAKGAAVRVAGGKITSLPGPTAKRVIIKNGEFLRLVTPTGGVVIQLDARKSGIFQTACLADCTRCRFPRCTRLTCEPISQAHLE